MSLLHIGGSSGTSVVPAEGVDFDGTYDYLSRSTDLVGNVDSKTFTFSCWVYVVDNTITNRIIDNTNSRFYLQFRTVNDLQILGLNLAGTTILNVTIGATEFNNGAFKNGFLHVLISLDLNNTANRHVYINDRIVSVAWNTYVNDIIDFAQSSWSVASGITASNKLKGRLSNVFLAREYLDLSIESNRRMFITSDGKPTPTATLKALNPILYLPMKDAATAHINEGTGGNFTANGTFATSNRGANQDNCVASYFDGTSDYLSRTSLSGIVNGKTFVLSFNFTQFNEVSNILTFSTSNSDRFNIVTNSGPLRVTGYNSSGTNILNFNVNITNTFINNKQYSVQIFIDLANTSNRGAIVNGNIASVTWNSYTNDLINFNISTTPQYRIGANALTPPTIIYGSLGELYFDTKYIDLSTNNPFWDSVANKPKPVRQVIAETGVTPLIAMPLDASNAGKNYGTGGDFTANSAPYVGARGASEFWARSVNLVASTSAKLDRLVSIPAFNTASIVVCHKISTTASDAGFGIQMLNAGSTASRFYFHAKASDIQVTSNGVTLGVNRTLGVDTWEIIFLSFDKTTLANNKLIVNGTNTTLTNYEFLNSVQYSNDEVRIGQTAGYLVGTCALCYFTTGYIDFSQEVNRNKFVDQLGYPKDLKAQIEAGVIPNPLIYLPFDDTTNLGKNLGTGGDFTVNGTVTAGSDVLG